ALARSPPRAAPPPGSGPELRVQDTPLGHRTNLARRVSPLLDTSRRLRRRTLPACHHSRVTHHLGERAPPSVAGAVIAFPYRRCLSTACHPFGAGGCMTASRVPLCATGWKEQSRLDEPERSQRQEREPNQRADPSPPRHRLLDDHHSRQRRHPP